MELVDLLRCARNVRQELSDQLSYVERLGNDTFTNGGWKGPMSSKAQGEFEYALSTIRSFSSQVDELITKLTSPPLADL